VGADSLYGGLLSEAVNTCTSAVKIKQYGSKRIFIHFRREALHLRRETW